MSLLDRLRPKWQNADAEVRAQAVRELPKGETDLLSAVAQQDPDPRVRRIALKKIDSPRILLEIAGSDADESLRSFAKKRARQQLIHIACDERELEESKRALALLTDASDRVAVAERARFTEVRALAFDSLTDDEALYEAVRAARDPELRARALAKIGSPHLLRRVVIEEGSGDLAQGALARIEDLEALETIFDQHTVARSLRRQAFSKLEKLVPPDHPIKARAREERFEEICQQAEKQAESRMPIPGPEIATLRESWSAVSAEGLPGPSLESRFRTAIESMEALARARPASPPPTPSASAPVIPTPVTTESSFPRILESLEGLADADLVSGIEPLRAQWESFAAQTAPGPELQSRFRRALKAALSRLEHTRALEALARDASTLVERAEAAAQEPELDRCLSELNRLDKEWSRLPEPPEAALEVRFKAALARGKAREEEVRARQDETEQRTLRDLEARIQLMETLASSDTLLIKDADRVLKETQDFLKEMGPLPKSTNRKKARKRLVDAREALFKRTQETRELEEWKRWANVDVQQTLIERVEKLKESNDLPKVAKELRKIHDEWKLAGTATPDKAQELWQRYKTLRDEIRARCDAFFEKQNQERAENLKLKEALCTEVESLKTSEDWNRTADAIKEIQARWKSIGPVPQDVSDALWKRFRAACDFFFDRRKQGLDELKSERDQNLSAKVALCERAEALQDSTSWQETANELKRLQSEWREVGAVPRKKSDEIWARFRAACDHFFDRFKRRDQIAVEEQLKQRESLVEALTALGATNGEPVDGIAEKVQKIWNDWKSAGPMPEVGSEILSRFERAVGALLLASPAAFSGTELDPAANAKKRGKIVSRLETLVGQIEPRKPETAESFENLAQRLKDALASNTIGGGRRSEPAMDWRQIADEVSRLRANWAKIAPVPGEDGRTLSERFERACRSFRERRPPERVRSHSSDRATLSRP